MKKLSLILVSLIFNAATHAMNMSPSAPIAIPKKSTTSSHDDDNMFKHFSALNIDKNQLIANQNNASPTLNRQLVPYNEPVHGDQARDIFYTTFKVYYDCLEPESYQIKKHGMIKEKVFVLLRQERVVGVLTYDDRKDTQGTTKRYINHFAIDEAYRKTPEKHGSFALQTFEAETIKAGIPIVELISYKTSAPFYRKCGYHQISHLYEMQKNLTSEEKLS